MRIIAYSLIIIGIFILIWNGFTWWEQRQAGVISISHAKVTDKSLQLPVAVKSAEFVTTKANLDSKDEGIISKGNLDNQRILNEEKLKFDYGDHVAELTIPKIDSAYPVFWGTDKKTLTQGVGMYNSKWTVTPNKAGHVVLSGHRDTVFYQLGELEVGDQISVMFQGVKYEYEINKIWITHKKDRSVITTKEQPTLTLTTCYPFDFIGAAPDRYIIQSELINKETIK